MTILRLNIVLLYVIMYSKGQVKKMSDALFTVITDFDKNLPYYFSGVGSFYEQENIYRPEGYPSYQWLQCREGRGELNLNGEKYIIEKGQGIFLFPDEPHEYHAIDGEWILDWIIFSGHGIKPFVKNILNMTASGVYFVTTPHIILSKTAELYNSAKSDGISKNLICSSLVYAILIDILRLSSVTQNTSIVNNFKRIDPVLNYINQNYPNQISLDELAGIAELTPQHLCNTFKKYTSQTLFEYINMVRIRKSKEFLLSNNNLQIKEIAHSVGFNDVSYFCRTFKNIEKISPTEFRSLYN